MSALNDSNYALDNAPKGFSPEENRRWDKGIEKAKKRAAATCRHLIKSKGEWKRPKRKWSRLAWQQYLDGKPPTLDEIVFGSAEGDSIDIELDDNVVIVPEDLDAL